MALPGQRVGHRGDRPIAVTLRFRADGRGSCSGQTRAQDLRDDGLPLASVAAAMSDGARVRRLRAGERGQAAVEVLGAVPALLALGLVVLQLLAVGYASVLAGSAAEAGALALAAGGDPEEGVRSSLAGWARARARVAVSGGTVRVRLRPPSPLKFVSRQLEVTARASVGGP